MVKDTLKNTFKRFYAFFIQSLVYVGNYRFSIRNRKRSDKIVIVAALPLTTILYFGCILKDLVTKKYLTICFTLLL